MSPPIEAERQQEEAVCRLSQLEWWGYQRTIGAETYEV
jgi:hypothetical protein